MKILVLAGGFDQIALINKLKERGNVVYLADYFKNPPAKPYVDKHFVVSTLDEEAIYKLARDEAVDLLTTACTDQALMTVAKVSARLKLPCYVSEETARNVTNKVYMKQRFSDYGIPTAKWLLLENELDFQKQLQQVTGYPLVVKPCDCNSSKGVARVDNIGELTEAVRYAFELSRNKKVIIEQYLEGKEISIDVWKDTEGAKVLSISETKKMSENQDVFTIYQSTYPITATNSMIMQIKEAVEKICNAFKLENCPVLVQAIINEEKLNVIEFSARMGGGSKYKLIEYMSGVDIMDAYVNRILGDATQIVHPVWSGKRIELNYVYAYNGTFDKMCGFEDCVKSGLIQELFKYKLEGGVIEKHITSSDRIAGFLIEAETQEQLTKRRKFIVDHVDILDKEGNSIMYKKCFC